MNMIFELQKEQDALFSAIELIAQAFEKSVNTSELFAQVQRLQPEQIQVAQKALLRYSQILEKASVERIDIKHDQDFLQFWLKEMNLIAPFDIKDYVTQGDIIEIYDHDLIQIGRNHTFYQFCSYDPLSLTIHPFPALFKRDESINQKILEHVQRCLDPQTPIHSIETPLHTMQEHHARHSRVYEIEHRFCSPLLGADSGKALAIFCTQRARYIGDSNIIGMGIL